MKIITLLLGLLCASQGFAATVSSGFIDTVGVLPIGTFHLAGNDFDVQGGFTEGVWPTNNVGFLPGMAISAFGTVIGNDIFPGSGTVMGVIFPTVLWGDLEAEKPSAFNLAGPSITINAPGVYAGSFTFTGALCGTDPVGPSPRPCVIDLPTLTGYGVLVLNGHLYFHAGTIYLPFGGPNSHRPRRAIAPAS